MFGKGLSACEYFVRQHSRCVRGGEWPAPEIRAFFPKGTTQKVMKSTILAAAEVHVGRRGPEGVFDCAWAAGVVQAMLSLGMFPNPDICFPSRRERYDNLEKILANLARVGGPVSTGDAASPAEETRPAKRANKGSASE